MPTLSPQTADGGDRLPSRIGRYEVTGLLGRGGMGAVYKARDPEIDRTVALKTINPLLLSEERLRGEFIERFRREARAAGRLSHPNIVSVHDLGTDEATGTPFIVMEYVSGASLEKVLSENASLPVEQAVEILEHVAAALAEAHRHGVIHRDIKPANVFLDARGPVKVGDFGVARLEGSELTEAGAGFGTPGYSAPEVLRGAHADARSDVFALGVLAYWLLTGQRPFPGATRESAAIEILERTPPPPSSLRPDLPEHVSHTVMRALEKSREARIASAEEFAAGLRQGQVAPSAIPPPLAIAPTVAAEPMPTATVAVATAVPSRRDPKWVLALLLLGAAALVALALVAHRRSEAPAARRPAVTAPEDRASPPPPRPIRTTSASAAPRSRDGGPIPDPGLDPAATGPRMEAEERVRDESKKARGRENEQDKKGREREHEGRKKGHGKGRGKN